LPKELTASLYGGIAPALITFTESDTQERARVEAFIRETYAEAYGAQIIVHYPILMSVADADGQLLAVMGVQSGRRGDFFLEQYLDASLEQELSRRSAREVGRGQILEVGNLAARSAGAAKFLFLAFHVAASLRQYDWVAVTATLPLHRYFNQLGIRTHQLAEADPARLKDTHSQWGSYYDKKPRVLANTIPQGLQALLAHFQAEYVDLEGMRLTLHDLPGRQ
jgi:hypothetical protein